MFVYVIMRQKVFFKDSNRPDGVPEPAAVYMDSETADRKCAKWNERKNGYRFWVRITHLRDYP
jgi:hypothetical protein